MTTSHTNTDLTQLFSFHDITERERLQVTEEVGQLVLESALQRLMIELDEEQLDKLEQILDKHAHSTGEQTMHALTTAFPQFAEYFIQEAEFFSSEVQQMLA